MALWHGTFIFFADPVYGWYLSSTAVFLYLSYNLHNVITWMKNKPFLPKWGSLLYIGTIILAFPYWIAEMYFNFEYNNDLGSSHFRQTRPWETLARDPWWIFTSCSLIYIIKREYELGVFELIRASPRFGILIMTISLSLIFIIADVVETATHASQNDGINPYWKVSTSSLLRPLLSHSMLINCSWHLFSNAAQTHFSLTTSRKCLISSLPTPWGVLVTQRLALRPSTPAVQIRPERALRFRTFTDKGHSHPTAAICHPSGSASERLSHFQDSVADRRGAGKSLIVHKDPNLPK